MAVRRKYPSLWSASNRDEALDERALFPAIGISAAVHVALLVFLPYRTAQPPRLPGRELIPVSLLQRQVPEAASQISTVSRREACRSRLPRRSCPLFLLNPSPCPQWKNLRKKKRPRCQ